MYVHIYTDYVHIKMCMCVCIYIYTHIHILIYIYIHTYSYVCSFPHVLREISDFLQTSEVS